MDENLEWLTQNTEDLKSNEGNLIPPPPQTPPPRISTSTPPFQVYLPFLAKIFAPPLVIQFSDGPTPPLPPY